MPIFTQDAVLIDPDLGDDENGDAFGPRRRPLDACQHRVDDILSEVVFAIGDVNFAAGDGIGAVIEPPG